MCNTFHYRTLGTSVGHPKYKVRDKISIPLALNVFNHYTCFSVSNVHCFRPEVGSGKVTI